MKNTNILKEHMPYKLREVDSLIEYLENMALKGWKLKEFNRLYHFEKIEPQKLYYTIGVIKKPAFHDVEQTDNSNEIIKNHTEVGWDFVDKNDDIIIFITDKEEMKPVETDERLKFKIIKNHASNSNSFWWFLFMLYNLYKFNVKSLTTSYFELVITFLIFIVFILKATQDVQFFIWKIKQKNKLKQNIKISYISKHNIKYMKIIRYIRISFFVIVIIAFIVGAIIENKYHNKTNSSSTFLANTTTVSLVLKDNSKISAEVFKSKHKLILNTYMFLYNINSNNISLPEWDADYIIESHNKVFIVYEESIIIFNDYILNYYDSIFDEKYIEQVKSLKD